MAEGFVQLPVDEVSAQFVTTDREFLVESADKFEMSRVTPLPVAGLLDQARKQFALGCVDYNNFGACCMSAFQAIEQLLCESLGEDAPKKGGLVNLVEKAKKLGLLNEYQFEYLAVFVRRFRNKAAHPTEPFRFTPGMSEQILAGCHRFVAEFSDTHFKSTAVDGATD